MSGVDQNVHLLTILGLPCQMCQWIYPISMPKLEPNEEHWAFHKALRIGLRSWTRSIVAATWWLINVDLAQKPHENDHFQKGSKVKQQFGIGLACR